MALDDDIFGGEELTDTEKAALYGEGSEAPPAAVVPGSEPEPKPEPTTAPAEPEPQTQVEPAEDDFKAKYENLKTALSQEREDRKRDKEDLRKTKETLTVLVDRFEKAVAPQVEPDVALSPDEQFAQDQARKVVDLAVAPVKQTVDEMARRQQEQNIVDTFVARAAQYEKEHPEYAGADRFVTDFAFNYAEAMWPGDAPDRIAAKQQMINQLRWGVFNHPDGPAALHRMATSFGFKGAPATPTQDPGHPTKAIDVPRSLGAAPGAATAGRTKTLQERAEALAKADEHDFAKVPTDEIESILKSLTA